MPEHDETDAPEDLIVIRRQTPEEEAAAAEFWAEVYELAEKRRKSKVKRWGVEDKVVDGETK